MKVSRLKPVNGRLLVLPIKQIEEKTEGGVIIPGEDSVVVSTSIEKKPEIGAIIDVDLSEDHKLNSQLKLGVKILFNKFAVISIQKKRQRILVMTKDNILGIYKDEEMSETSK